MRLLIEIWLIGALFAFTLIGPTWWYMKDHKSTKVRNLGMLTIVPILSLLWPFIITGLLLG